MKTPSETSQVIRVGKEVREALDRIRRKHGLRNYSDAILHLLREAR